MSGLSVRSMELNRRWGISEKVKRAGWPQTRPNDFVYCTSMIGPSLTRVRIPPYVDKHPPYTPEPDCGCAQIFYDPILLERVRTLPSVTLAPHDEPRLLRTGCERRARDCNRPQHRQERDHRGRISRRLRRRRRRGRDPAQARLRRRRRFRQEHEHLFPLARADGAARQGLGALLPLHRHRRHLGRDHRHRRQRDLAALGAEGDSTATTRPITCAASPAAISPTR